MSRRAIDAIVARREDRLITSCGCTVLPDAVTRVLGDKPKAWCSEHGMVDIDHAMTLREVTIHALQLPEDWKPCDSDIPPF